ncbi:L,D-transpeptidase family protein [bacterium]|nr:L,D-transpeptidase family protein [bacterium]
MKSHLRIALITLMLFISTAPAPAQLSKLRASHAAFWDSVFGAGGWDKADIGFVVTKRPPMLHVVRLDGGQDTIASFEVCAMDVTPGFKAREGDGRTPEGIYHISLLNSASSYHLSMKINYPNQVDDARYKKHSASKGERWSQGGDIFIHGKCASVGCIAMTDEVIEKLYLLVASRPSKKQSIPVLLLPYDSEAAYQQMFFHADEQYEETGSVYWLLLRNHIENMRDLWRCFRDTGSIPRARVTADACYLVPQSK